MDFRRLFFSLLVVTSICGCSDSGPDLGFVSGTITLDGEPLAEARVLFQPKLNGPPSSAYTDKSGNYKLMYGANKAGAMLGEHLVQVTTGRPVSSEEYAQGISYPERVPPKYNSESELVREVISGDNVIDLKLEGELPPDN